jgi:hypothetical protein
MPSELKICDVQEIFTRSKMVPAEKIIARLLGEVYRHKKYAHKATGLAAVADR